MSKQNAFHRSVGERVKITTVEDSFLVAERGTIVTGIWLDESQELRLGDLLELVLPDQTVFQTRLSGVELFTKCFGDKRNIGLLLGEVKEKSEIPKGCEVWLLAGHDENEVRARV